MVVGGNVQDEDVTEQTAMGMARVYTPEDFQLNRVMVDIVTLADPSEAILSGVALY